MFYLYKFKHLCYTENVPKGARVKRKGKVNVMKITVVGRQMNVYDEMKLLIEKKLAKFDKFFPAEGDATVTLSCKHNEKSIEITISAGGTLFRSEVRAESFRDALDEACSNIERQIRKNKTRLEKRLREGALEREAAPAFAAVQEDEDEEFNIVRSKRFSIKPMSPEEAILQMNLLEHEFFVFRNDEEDGAISVVYRRNKGGYGLICDDRGE